MLNDVVDRIPIFDPAGEFDAPGNIGSGVKDEIAFALSLPTDRFGLKRGVLTGQATVALVAGDRSDHRRRPAPSRRCIRWTRSFTSTRAFPG